MNIATTVSSGDIKSPTVVAVSFTCIEGERRDLVYWWAKEILEQARLEGLDPDSPDFVLLSCSLEPCGGKASYHTADDIPLVDVPCPCGNPNHWLIKWIGPEQNVTELT